MALNWQPITALAGQTTFGWTSEADADGVDPYAVWADGTSFQGFLSIGKPVKVPMLVELSIEPAVQGPAPVIEPWFAIFQQLKITLAGAHINRMNSGHVFATLLVPVTSVLFLKDMVLQDGTKLRWRATLSLPRIASVDPKNYQARALASPTLAIIDDGCPFAHEHFRSGTTSRIHYLWDQGAEPCAPWQSPLGFGYGRELDNVAIEKLLADSGAEVDEDACYANAKYEDAVRRKATHGSVVMDIAAGAPDPLRCAGSPPDAAGRASIIFVQLPRAAVVDVSGGALNSYVLDALRYIDDRTKNVPVAINISYGASAGPHDGTSIIDAAIDDFLRTRKDCAVVVAAGNTHDADTHARVPVAATSHKPLTWGIVPDDETDSYLEIWVPDADDDGRRPSIGVRLVPPGEDASGPPIVTEGQARFGCVGSDASAEPVCAVINARQTPNGRLGRMILVAVAPTAPSENDRAPAPAGSWTVEIHNTGSVAVEVHAWIERDDASFGGKGRQSRFQDDALQYVDRKTTLSSLAHGERVITAGGSFEDEDRPLAPYSASGPYRTGAGSRHGPDVVAGSEESRTLHGLRAGGTRSGITVRMRGTSVATAVVTRRVFNDVLSKSKGGMSSDQVKACLTPDISRDPAESPLRVGQGRLKSRR